MAPVTPRAERILAFRDAASFEAWLARHHDSSDEIWLRIHKKASGIATVTYVEALDVALCWGWIDGLKKSYDETSFLQRFTPRKAKSQWSQLNREHVARLLAAGRMTEHGLRHVEAAKADGRWDAAYASQRSMELPAELLAAIEADPRARATFATLSKADRYSIAFRIHALKTVAARARRIAETVERLARGDTAFSPAVRGRAS